MLDRIDAHCHLFRDGHPGHTAFGVRAEWELADYERLRAEHGIVRALVVAYEGEHWARGNSSYVQALAERPDWIVPTAFWHPLGRTWADPEARALAVYARTRSEARDAAVFLISHLGLPGPRRAEPARLRLAPLLALASDFAPVLAHTTFDDAVAPVYPSGLSPQERAAVDGGNAARWLERCGL